MAPTGSQVLCVADNARYDEDVHLRVPAGARLVFVAAAWPDGGGGVPGFYLPDGLRAHLHGTLTITGGPGSSVVLDGVLLDGDLTIAPGLLGSLTVSQSTIAGRITVLGPAAGSHTAGLDTAGSNGDLQVRVVRSLVGGIELGAVVPGLSVTDSVVDAALDPRAVSGAAAVSGTTVHAAFDGVTVRGEVTVRSIDASSCVFDGPLSIAHRQTGSLRYCYTRPGSPTPRRFQCVPAEVWGQEARPLAGVRLDAAGRVGALIFVVDGPPETDVFIAEGEFPFLSPSSRASPVPAPNRCTFYRSLLTKR